MAIEKVERAIIFTYKLLKYIGDYYDEFEVYPTDIIVGPSDFETLSFGKSDFWKYDGTHVLTFLGIPIQLNKYQEPNIVFLGGSASYTSNSRKGIVYDMNLSQRLKYKHYRRHYRRISLV